MTKKLFAFPLQKIENEIQNASVSRARILGFSHLYLPDLLFFPVQLFLDSGKLLLAFKKQ